MFSKVKVAIVGRVCLVPPNVFAVERNAALSGGGSDKNPGGRRVLKPNRARRPTLRTSNLPFCRHKLVLPALTLTRTLLLHQSRRSSCVNNGPANLSQLSLGHSNFDLTPELEVIEHPLFLPWTPHLRHSPVTFKPGHSANGEYPNTLSLCVLKPFSIG